MIEAILFDLGDTIIDFGIGRREAEELFREGAKLTYDYLHNHRHPHLPTFERYFRVHYGIMRRAWLWSRVSRRDFSYQHVLTRAAKRLKMHLTDVDIHFLAQLWYQPINRVSVMESGVVGMLEELKRSGTKLGIVSNTLVPAHCLDQHLAENGVLEFFPVRVYSSQVRYRKPHPRIFEIALSQIGVPASRTLFIGDLLTCDIAGAKRAGMRTIWKPARKVQQGGRYPTPKKRHAPDFVITRVTHLPEALQHFGWRPMSRPRQHMGT
jgi:HAD superfamily hydrolase (TIGR01662 family)